METLARLVIRHRLVVVLGWLVLMVAGGAVASTVTDRLTFDFSLPGQPGYEAEEELIATFGSSTADTLLPVVTVLAKVFGPAAVTWTDAPSTGLPDASTTSPGTEPV